VHAMIFSLTISSLFIVLVGSLRNKAPVRLHYSKSAVTRLSNSAEGGKISLNAASDSLEPINVNEFKIPGQELAATTTLLTVLLSMTPANALKDMDDVDIYKDMDNGFSVAKLPGWSLMPKQPPTLSLQAIQPEEVIFVASSFMEGEFIKNLQLNVCTNHVITDLLNDSLKNMCIISATLRLTAGPSSLLFTGASITVTRSNAGKLLKDFNIDWWFAPLNSMADVGSPELIARLLSLQHQGVVSRRDVFVFLLQEDLAFSVRCCSYIQFGLFSTQLWSHTISSTYNSLHRDSSHMSAGREEGSTGTSVPIHLRVGQRGMSADTPDI
jgi:hypothetical protein